MSAIVCIGEILWDIHADGTRTPGGAPFNVAYHCQQLGHEGIIVSRVGDDELGYELRDLLHQYGMSDEFLQTDMTHPTGTVQVEIIDGEPQYTITEDVAWDYIKPTETVWTSQCDAVVFGTLALRYGPNIWAIDKLVHKNAPPRLRVCDLNIRSGYYTMETLAFCRMHCDWLKVSNSEHELVGSRTSAKVRIITSGSAGARIETEGNNHTLPAHPCNVVDTIGAGDAFTAALLCLHLEGRSLEEAGRFASRYAARVCEHRGATPIIDRSSILEEWKQ